MRRERPRDIFPSVSTVNFRRGTKVFTGTLNGERAVIHCPCDIYPGALIAIKMSAGQARALSDRRPAREVLGGFSRDVIELFTSGLTPAEFDQLFAGGARPVHDYELYTEVGPSEPTEKPTEGRADEQMSLPG